MHLSIITATYNRPTLLGRVVRDVLQQSANGLDIEHVVVSDGPDAEAKAVCAMFPTVNFHETPKQKGLWGASAKDYGISVACGDYVVFWDDDNVYYPHAAVAMYSVSVGHDIGVARFAIKEYNDSVPFMKEGGLRKETFGSGSIDSGCFCVRRELAKTERWDAYKGRDNDHNWISRIHARSRKPFNFTPTVIGIHY